MWKQNFMFRWNEAAPLPPQTENELFRDTDPALNSAGLQLEKCFSLWLQGDGDDGKPETYATCTSVPHPRTRAEC